MNRQYDPELAVFRFDAEENRYIATHTTQDVFIKPAAAESMISAFVQSYETTEAEEADELEDRLEDWRAVGPSRDAHRLKYVESEGEDESGLDELRFD